MHAHVESVDPGAELPEESRELGRLFDRLHNRAASQVFYLMAGTMHSVDLSFSQLNALFHMLHHGPRRIADLARNAQLSHAATSRLVDGLVRDGLADKRPNPDNRRERLVRLTPRGRDCLRNLQELTALAYAELFLDLPPDVSRQLLEILRPVAALLPKEPAA